MRTFLSIIAVIFIINNIVAQATNPKWISTIENSKTNNFQSTIQADSSGILIVRNGFDNTVYERKLRSNAVEQYDLSGKLVYRKEYDDKDKYPYFILSAWTGSHYLFMVREHDSKTQKLVFKTLTSQNLDIRNANEKNIFSKNTIEDQFTYNRVSISKDLKKFALVNTNGSNTSKKASPLNINVISFDSNGEKLWEKEIVNAEFDDYFSETLSSQIDNEGDIAILQKNYAKDNTSKRESYKVEKEIIDGFYYELIYISDNGNKVSRSKITLDNGTVTDVYLSDNNGGGIDLIGMFGSPKDNAFKGTFYGKVNKNGKVENIIMDKFSAEFVGQFNEKHTSDIDKTALHSNFEIAQVEYRNDGGFYLISEYLENYYTGGTTYLICGYMIVSSIDKDGKVIFHKKIPKFHSGQDGICSSFFGYVKDEKLNLIYNESKENIQKPFDKSFLKVLFTRSSTIMRTIDTQGEITSVELWQNKDYSTVFIPSYAHIINDNRMLYFTGGIPYFVKPSKLGLFTFTK